MTDLKIKAAGPERPSPDVSIILTAWNVRPLLKDALLSVAEKTRGVRYEIIVVDDASSDGTGEMMKKEFPDATLITLGENVGFSRANNLGAGQATGRYLLLLNTDTILVNNAIGIFVDYLDHHPDTAVCGGTLKFPDMRNHISYGSFPSFHQALVDALFLNDIFPGAQLPNRGVYPPESIVEPMEVDYVTGAAILIRKELTDLYGLFDERYRAYCEETDFCYRMKHEAKKKIMYIPEAHVIHLAGVSYRNVRRYQTQLMYSSYNKFLTKYHGAIYAFCTRVLYAWHFGIRTLSRGVKYLAARPARRDERLADLKEVWYCMWYSLIPNEEFTGA